MSYGETEELDQVKLFGSTRNNWELVESARQNVRLSLPGRDSRDTEGEAPRWDPFKKKR